MLTLDRKSLEMQLSPHATVSCRSRFYSSEHQKVKGPENPLMRPVVTSPGVCKMVDFAAQMKQPEKRLLDLRTRELVFSKI